MSIRELTLASAALVAMTGFAAAQTTYEFSELDTNADGFVDLAELEAAFESSTDPQADASLVLAAEDTDEDGMISLEEAGADGQIVSSYPDGEDGFEGSDG